MGRSWKGVDYYFSSPKENLTFTGNDDAMSTLMLSMMGAFAEFERALIRERQKGGVYKGRKPAHTPAQADQLRTRAAAGEKKSALAREFKVSRETLTATSGRPDLGKAPEGLKEERDM